MDDRPLPPPFEVSARRDWRPWACLTVGGAFAVFAQLASSAEACAASGTCSQLLTAGVTGAGLLACGTGALALWRNASRGSRFDSLTGELRWWQHRRADDPGLHGAIHPRDIAAFRLIAHDEGEDTIQLVDNAGEIRLWFDGEVLPRKDRDAWFAQVLAAWPHIGMERR